MYQAIVPTDNAGYILSRRQIPWPTFYVPHRKLLNPSDNLAQLVSVAHLHFVQAYLIEQLLDWFP